MHLGRSLQNECHSKWRFVQLMIYIYMMFPCCLPHKIAQNLSKKIFNLVFICYFEIQFKNHISFNIVIHFKRIAGACDLSFFPLQGTIIFLWWSRKLCDDTFAFGMKKCEKGERKKENEERWRKRQRRAKRR